MKTLIVSQYFWPENFRINSLAAALSDKGIEIEVLTGQPNYPEGEIFVGYKAWKCITEKYQRMLVHRVPLVARGQGALSLALNYLSFVFSALLLAPWMLRGKKFDLVFVYAPSPILQAIPAIFLGWIKRAPVILWVQDLWPESMEATGYVTNRYALRAIEAVVRFIYRRTDLLLVQSPAFISPVLRLAPGKIVKYYPNSVDEEPSGSSELNLPDVPGLGEAFTVLFAGNIGNAQAVEVIIEAATLLKERSDIRFVILGEGSRRNWMLQMAAQRNLANVYLPGRFPVETMPGLMQKASVLLVTLADRDIFRATIPSKVQTYLAAGRPIVACLNGVGADVVREAGAGFAVPAEDARALAEAIVRLYEMPPEERDALGENGRKFCDAHFSRDLLVNQLITHFASTLESKQGTV